jgi:hypothetical protein
MKQVTLTSDVGRQPFGDVVRGLEPGEVEVLDSDGRVVALLTRVPETDASVYAAIAKAAAADAEELRRRQREVVTGATTSEVLSRLLRLPPQG